nr:MAG TPA: hypothetical protein [Caudoviricetes sp.]
MKRGQTATPPLHSLSRTSIQRESVTQAMH